MYRLFLGSLKHKIMNGVFLGGVDNSNSNTSGHGYSASKRTTIHRPHGRTKLAIDSCTRQRLRFCHLLPEELIILSNMQQFRKKKSKKKISAERSWFQPTVLRLRNKWFWYVFLLGYLSININYSILMIW